MTEYKDMTTEQLEALEALEEWLYDCEVDGYDVWWERDQLLQELAKRELSVGIKENEG